MTEQGKKAKHCIIFDYLFFRHDWDTPADEYVDYIKRSGCGCDVNCLDNLNEEEEEYVRAEVRRYDNSNYD